MARRERTRGVGSRWAAADDDTERPMTAVISVGAQPAYSGEQTSTSVLPDRRRRDDSTAVERSASAAGPAAPGPSLLAAGGRPGGDVRVLHALGTLRDPDAPEGDPAVTAA